MEERNNGIQILDYTQRMPHTHFGSYTPSINFRLDWQSHTFALEGSQRKAILTPTSTLKLERYSESLTDPML